MMVKLASPLDWQDMSQSGAVEVKIASRGWMLADRQKVAAEVGDEFIARVRKIEDQLDNKNFKFAHITSCGATEVTGPNRNGDGWRGSVLKEQMPNYLKYAACYRNHRNKKDNDCFGYPKLAMYDPSRGYGRLLVGYHATEKACKEPRDKVASHECDALDRGEDIKVSHGSAIPYDVCSICGNKAPERKDYCDSHKFGGECDLFGCKTGLKKVANDGRTQYVDNPINRFYDISSIALVPGPARQADRVAFAIPFDMFHKAAAEEDGLVVLGSAKMASEMGLHVPDEFQIELLDTPWQKGMMKAALWLADYASKLSFEEQTELPERFVKIGKSADTRKIAAAVQSLADNEQMLGPRAYCRFRGADDATAELVAIMSKTCAAELHKEDYLANFVAESPLISSPSPSRDKLAYGCRLPEQFDLRENALRNSRISQVLFAREKVASAAQADARVASKLAAEYLACQVLAASVLFDKK